MRGETRQVTVRASAWQVFCWESTARWAVKGGDVRRFIIVAADALARRLREVNYQRQLPDRIAKRLHEKVLLGDLMKAAQVAVEHLPKQVDTYLHGSIYPRKDLWEAIENVRRFLAETGEEYGPCP
jgi:hypothetical protein